MRKPIKCEYCVFEACKECCSTYLLNVNKPGCMSPTCAGEWSREFISDNLTKVFANTKLRQHKADMLWKEQLSWMPETQLEIEEEKRQAKITLKIRDLNNQRSKLRHNAYSDPESIKFRHLQNKANFEERELNHTIQILKRDFQRAINKQNKNNNDQIKDEIIQLKLKISDLVKQKDEMFYKIRDINNNFHWHIEQLINPDEEQLKEQIRLLQATWRTPTQNDESIEKKKSGFVRKCADPDCRGFLSSRWKCGLCEKYTCTECNELKCDDDHTCDPNNVATSKLLSKDTKGCPACQTSIYKTDGCDQMWCTQCHTAFSWKTGQIETKIHNPHYYEWRRQNGGLAREPGDIGCGNELNYHDFPNIIRNALLNDKHYQTVTEFNNVCTYISDVVRNCVHLQFVIIPTFRRGNNQTFAQLTNTHRREYLTKVYTLEEFKHHVERLDRKKMLDTENEQVINLLIDSVKEILFRFKTSAESDNCNVKILDEIQELVKYANRCLMRIGVTYTTVSAYRFSPTIEFSKHKTDRKTLL